MTQFFIFLHKFTGKIKMLDIQLYGQQIFHLIVSPDQTIFAISVQCFHMILETSYCICPYPVRFGKFCFNGSLKIFVTLPMFKSETHETWQFQYLGHVMWQLDKEISEIGTRFWKIKLHQNIFSEVCYDLNSNKVWLPIFHRQANKCTLLGFMKFCDPTINTQLFKHGAH
jgi:hypothetical protein